jgi:hypothetical protein
VLVVCGGKKTEPTYFQELRREEEVRLVEIIVDASGCTPKALIERALKLRKESDREAKRLRDVNLRYDEVWCVFDVDEHLYLSQAIEQARVNRISLAISNPCFELWILLHFRDQAAYIHRHDAQRDCAKFIKGYKKLVSYVDLRETYDDALRRAVQLDKRHAEIGEEGENPSTSVYRLTERLRELSRHRQLQMLRGEDRRR